MREGEYTRDRLSESTKVVSAKRTDPEALRLDSETQLIFFTHQFNRIVGSA